MCYVKNQLALCLIGCFGVAILLTIAGCQEFTDLLNPEDADGGNLYTNATDPTNRGAGYLGSAACRTCHPDQAALQTIHGTSHSLRKLSGGPPTYPSAATRAGVPTPPSGESWSDITYVIGGYHRKGRFIDSQGYVMTDGVNGVNTQWNLEFLPTGTVAGWTSYHSDQVDPKPYDFSCFQCHTTGPSQSGSQDSLLGIQGTFLEPGVQCEACHGPGSSHPPDPLGGTIFVDAGAAACGTCHSRGTDMNVIPVSGGYIRHHQQYQELLASPHADLRCVVCHEPHTSVAYDLSDALINSCQSCHPDQNMALHSGRIFVRGDYTEVLSCESCHMPFATKSAAAATVDVVGAEGRMGDVRTHIWYIDTSPADYTDMFTADGGSVKKDAAGNASVTVDFVCMRCHSDIGNAFALTVRSASSIALEIHQIVP